MPKRTRKRCWILRPGLSHAMIPRQLRCSRFVTEFEETVEPDPRLKQFYNWLQAKGCNSTAVLARWWIAEFVEEAERSPSRGANPHNPLGRDINHEGCAAHHNPPRCWQGSPRNHRDGRALHRQLS